MNKIFGNVIFLAKVTAIYILFMQRTLLLGVLAVFVLYSCQSKRQKKMEGMKIQNNVVEEDSATTVPEKDAFGFSLEDTTVKEGTIDSNESLYVLLSELGFEPGEIYSISKKAKQVVDMRSMRPGQTYRVYKAKDDSTLSRLVWQKNAMQYVVLEWQDDQEDPLKIYKASKPLATETDVTAGVINNSLYQTISDEGRSPLLAGKMAKIFAWQVDFFRLQKGDRFKTLYNRQFVDDAFIGPGDILAAELEHADTTFKAFYFSKGDISGFYTEEGESVQRALLKAPFEYDHRISSAFSRNRMHPTLHTRRPHNGVDYAAPRGTPIHATGDGEVIEAQYRGANGNIVRIQHNRTYRTYYLHLSKFAKGVHPGIHVEQGQVIGYVGTTGRSTGPHLHYEVRKNGNPINPLTMDLPSSESIPDSLMEEFKKVRDDYKRQLENVQDDDNAIVT